MSQLEETKRQITTSLIIAWQNEWHNKEDIKARDYLMTNDQFKRDLQGVISQIYPSLEYRKTDMERILDEETLREKDKDNLRKQFQDALGKQAPVEISPGIMQRTHPLANVNGSNYTAYDAAERMLLIFDRLACVRDMPEAEELLKQYRPVLRYLGEPLQAFIAVTYIALVVNKKYRNYENERRFFAYYDEKRENKPRSRRRGR